MSDTHLKLALDGQMRQELDDQGNLHITINPTELLRGTTALALKECIETQLRAWDVAETIRQALGTEADVNHLVVQLAATHNTGDDVPKDALEWLLSTATTDPKVSLKGYLEAVHKADK